MKRLFLYLQICTALIATIMAVSCTFSRLDDTPLTISSATPWLDTTDLWPTIRLALSVPLADSIAALELFPTVAGGYQSYLSASRDTLVFTVTSPEGLVGSTAFTIRPVGILTASNGSVLNPEDGAFTFSTLASEHESNNLPVYADTIVSSCCGVLYPAHDTDYYFWPDHQRARLRCRPLSGAIAATAIDTTGTALSVAPQTDGSLLITSSESFGSAALIAIYPLQAGTHRYRITPEEIP